MLPAEWFCGCEVENQEMRQSFFCWMDRKRTSLTNGSRLSHRLCPPSQHGVSVEALEENFSSLAKMLHSMQEMHEEATTQSGDQVWYRGCKYAVQPGCFLVWARTNQSQNDHYR